MHYHTERNSSGFCIQCAALAGRTVSRKTNYHPARIGSEESLGGPLRIPHVYDGRDKTFFFLNVNIGHGDTANF